MITTAALGVFALTIANAATTVYSPSRVVNIVRGVPRIGFNFELNRPATFALSPSTIYLSSNPYLQSIITFPAILLSAAIIAFVVVPTVLLTRFCLQCSSCAPEASDQYVKYALQPQKWSREVATNRGCLLFFFWVGFAIAVCGAHMLWYGTSLYDPAMASLRSSVQYVQGQYARVETTAQTFLSTAGTMYVGVDQSPCRFANASAVVATKRGLVALSAASQAVYDTAYGLPLRLGQMDAYLATYGQQAKLVAVSSGYAWATFVCLLSALAVGLRNKAFTQVLFAFSTSGPCNHVHNTFITHPFTCSNQAAATLQFITSAAVTLVAFFISVILIAWADFCADPVASTLQVFGQVNVTATPLYPYAAYYTTCAAPGTAPQRALTPTHSALAQVATAGMGVAQSLSLLSNKAGRCPNDANLVKAYGQLITVLPGNITASALGINCTQPTGARMNDAVYNQICGGMYTGFTAFTLCYLAVGFGMFLMLVTSVVVYNHYEEEYWSQLCCAAGEEDVEETYGGKNKDTPFTSVLQPPARNLMMGRPLLWGSVQANTAHETRWHDDALMELYGPSASYGAPSSPASRRPPDAVFDPAGGIGRVDPVKTMPKYGGEYVPKQPSLTAYMSLLYAPTVTEPQEQMNLRYRERQRRPPKEGGDDGDGDAFAAPTFGEGDGEGEEKAEGGEEGGKGKDEGKKTSWFARFRKNAGKDEGKKGEGPGKVEANKGEGPEKVEGKKGEGPGKAEGKEADEKRPPPGDKQDADKPAREEKPEAKEKDKGKDEGNDAKKPPPRDQQSRVY